MITKETIREAEEELGLREIIDSGLSVLRENEFFQVVSMSVKEETLAPKQKPSQGHNHD